MIINAGSPVGLRLDEVIGNGLVIAVIIFGDGFGYEFAMKVSLTPVYN